MIDGGKSNIQTNNSVELYNLKDDIGEKKNLSNSNPLKRDELLQDLFKKIKETGARIPDQKNPLYGSLEKPVQKKNKNADE